MSRKFLLTGGSGLLGQYLNIEAAKENDIAQSAASIDLAQRELGFNTKISLLDGLKSLKKEQIKY